MNAIELVRVSTEAQANDSFGIPAQRTANRQTAQRYGLRIVKSIELAASGAKVLLTPEFQELLRLIQSPDVGAVVTKEFSRLMRPENLGDMALLQAFKDSNTLLYLPEGPIDFGEKIGQFMGTVRAAVAGLERAEIRDRCMRGKAEARAAGGFAGHPLAYGVEYDKRTGWHYTEKAERVRDCFTLILAGETRYEEFGKLLGVTPSGAAQILVNPIYAGFMVYGRRKRETDGAARVKVIDKPLIQEHTFERATAILRRKREAGRRCRENGWALYNGFVFCARCGSLLTPTRVKSRGGANLFGYYACMKRRKEQACDQPNVPALVLEESIDLLVGEQLTTRSFARRIADNMRERIKRNSSKSRVEKLQSNAKTLAKKRSTVVDLYIEGVISKDERDARLRAIQDDQARVREELERLDQTSSPQLTAEQVEEIFSVFKAWDSLGREDRRKLLEVTIPKFRVDGGRVVSFYSLCDKNSASSPAFLSAKQKQAGVWFDVRSA